MKEKNEDEHSPRKEISKKTKNDLTKNIEKSLWLKEWAPIVLPIFALLLSLHNCVRKNEIQKDLDFIESIKILKDYQPKVKLIGKPICDSVVFVLDTIQMKKEIKNFNINDVNIKEENIGDKKILTVDGFGLTYNPIIYYKLKFTNENTNTGKIIYASFWDDLEGSFIIKDNLDSLWNFAQDAHNKLPINNIIDYGDTTVFEIGQPILNYKSNKFQIHILIYYLNNLENLYETYIWIEGKIQKKGFSFKYGEDKYTIPIQKKYPCTSIFFGSTRDIFNYYLPGKKDSIISALQKLKAIEKEY